ncbi:IS630 family transposase [Mariniblastus fucicola]|uniref:IS630 family transposase n=1 Tax=Mariniblastus fucicola TaxID=980251 RepID=UPI00192E3F74|nr:IS630 family transposase [Mariniblastus fucicola]
MKTKSERFVVDLTDSERHLLKDLIRKGGKSVSVLGRARVLLKADQGKTDQENAEFSGVSLSTVFRIRRRFVEEGLESAVFRKNTGKRIYRKLDGKAEATLIATACSEAPEGRSRWTLRLLADRLIALEVVDSVSHECVRETLKKNELKPHLKEQWVIPPEKNAEFVAAMEDVLEVYQRPYDAKRPVVCLDETSKQLVGETRTPIPAKPGTPAREDYEYKRNGVANLFMLFEPLAGWRHVEVTDRRTKVDFAHVVKKLVDELDPDAEKIVLVMDNLNTHKPGSLYEAFEPQEARRLIEKLEIHYTPKHGSWLNMAETELASLAKQCLNRRIPTKKTLEKQVAAWNRGRNESEATVDWQFKTDDARIKLKKLYPSIQL